ncbi:MAG TPA: NAD(+) diphosphatase [Actinomycetaceae bacterium]|nr:NAD(+) diphosphatase [Actinomycetaceae bacterium]
MKPLIDLPLSRQSLDPDTLGRRDETLIGRLCEDPTTRAVVVDELSRPALLGDALHYVSPNGVAESADMTVAYLGRQQDGAAVILLAGPEVPGLEYRDVRTVVGMMGEHDRGVVVPATALANWHRRHRFCPRCGGQTTILESGWVRRCRACETQHFPRIDPAVIMAVIDGADRLLLAHAAHFGPRRYSTLAGYVEPGENLEHAVVRETWEEVGLNVTEVVYRGSQPWPFPRSLMLAYTARVAGTPEPVADGEEIVHARFFTRDELARSIADGEVTPPGGASVAYALVEDWFGGPLPERAG